MNRFASVTRPLMWFTALLFAALAAGCGGGGGGGQGAILAPPGLVSIAVTPATASVPIGGAQQFTATATFGDGSTKNVTTSSTWSSGAPANATVVPTTGLATGVAPGVSVITATYGGKTGTATLTVTNAAVVSIAVTPLAASVAISGVQQFTATATYSDGTFGNVTTGSTWNSATPAVATIGLNTGVAVGVSGGTSLITASFGGITSLPATLTVTNATLVSIAVTPSTALIPATGTQQFTATATYSDASTSNVTAATAWTSGTPGVATILTTGGTTPGLATGVAIGQSTITATYNGQVATATLNVTVNLGRAASFGLLAGTSLTNNAGTTTVTGDVGYASITNTGVLTVIPPYTEVGSVGTYPGAITDLGTAITAAGVPACTTSYVGATDFATLTLAPGVYCVSGAINNTGTLTLNGAGIYIFRTTVAAALTPAAGSNVVFAGGATNANTSVLWVVNSASLTAPTVPAAQAFIGSILTPGAITLGNGLRLVNGRALSSAAALTTTANTIIKPTP